MGGIVVCYFQSRAGEGNVEIKVYISGWVAHGGRHKGLSIGSSHGCNEDLNASELPCRALRAF